MSNEILRTAKRMGRIKMEAANRFDASLLHYRVYDSFGDAGCIRQFVGLVKKVYQLEKSKVIYTDDVRQMAFSAAEELNILMCVVYNIKRFVKQ
jgi:molybdopterin synthase catalytic subunit